MARRSRFLKHTLTIDGDAVEVRFRRQSGLEASTGDVDIKAAQMRLAQAHTEFERKLEAVKAAIPDDSDTSPERFEELAAGVPDAMDDLGRRLAPEIEKLIRFLHEHIVGITGLEYERADGEWVAYDDADEDEQLWLIKDCFAPFSVLLGRIRGEDVSDDLGKSSAPGASVH